MRRLVLIATMLTLVLAAAPAQAAEPGIVVGERVFGALPCGAPALSLASFTSPATLAGADPTACAILLSRRYAREMPAATRCTLVLHEYGHLAGHEHVDDPDSVMHHEYVRDDRRCVTATRPFSASSRSTGKRPRAAGTSGTGRRRA